MNKRTVVTAITALTSVAAAALLLASLKLPLWHLKMEAPQYKDEEALKVNIYPAEMTGDLREIRVLNQYIGVHVPESLPQLRWLPVALIAGAALGLIAIVMPGVHRWRSLITGAAVVTVAIAAAAGMAQWQMHDIGHHRDHHTILKGVHDFTPPLLGRVKVANFEITSTLGSGAWLVGAALALQIGTALWCRRSGRITAPAPKAAAEPLNLSFRTHAI